jgi:AcrR family transcriptional regulator
MALEKLNTETRQEQILEAAIVLIAAQGIRRLSVTSLARRVGLAPSALYRHFRGKQQILEAAMQSVQRQALENLKEVSATTPSALERLKLLLTRVIKMVRELQAMPQIVFAGAMCGARPQRTRQAYGFLKGVLAAIEAIMREGQEHGEI